MYTVADLMTREVITLDENENLGDASRILARKHIRHLPVVRDKKLVGLVTHRDILRCVGGQAGGKCRAGDIMVTHLTTITPEMSLYDAVRIMRQHKYGCLPVVDDEHVLVGILTEADLVRFAEQAIERQDRRELAADYRA